MRFAFEGRCLFCRCEGHSHSRTFFSRTKPSASHEDAARGKPNSGDVSTAAAGKENDATTSAPPSRNAPAVGNTQSGNSQSGNTQSGNSARAKHFAREGRGGRRQQRNGYRRPPTARGPTDSQAPPISEAQQGSSDTAGNPRLDSPSSEMPGSSASGDSAPLPQRQIQRRGSAKDQPPAANSSAAVESVNT